MITPHQLLSNRRLASCVLVATLCCASGLIGSVSAAEPFVPNDPNFYTDSVPGFPGQWHLDKQTSGAQVDVNIRGAWNRGLTGEGVVIGIVEDTVELSHPDLSPNARPDLSWDFFANGPLTGSSLRHATSVAGVAAGRGGNGIGTTGAAPHAQLASLRATVNSVNIEEFASYDAREAAAIRYRSDEIAIKNYSSGFPFQMISMPLIDEAFRETAEDGMINVVAAMNNRGNTFDNRLSADTNQNPFQHGPDVIVVAGLGSDGKFASYSNFGASVTATAPTSGWQNMNVTTTDLTGPDGYNGTDPFPDQNYTTEFSGTSSAAPLVSGIMALAKEAQPNLDVRFAKHLLAETSRIVDATDSTSMGGWQTNAAGFHFNNNYGFGLIDADALTLAATKYSGVTALELESTGRIDVGAIIPENDPNGTVSSISLAGGHPLEEITVRLTLSPARGPSNYFGDIAVELTSPSGMHSILMYPDLDSNYLYLGGFVRVNPIDWTFTSNAFWGEDATGDWKLSVYDRSGPSGIQESYQEVLVSYELTARYGSLVPIPTRLPGDANGDGLVDGADYTAWADHYLQTDQSWEAGDFNGDGIVDGADYTVWADHFSPAHLSLAAVPEPSTFALAGVGTVALLLYGRRRSPR